MLQGIDATFKQSVGGGRLDVLVTRSPTGLALPLAQLSQIEAVQGIRWVTSRALLVGDYQSAHNLVIVAPIDADSFFVENPVYGVQRAASHRTRTGVLFAQDLAQRPAWKIGDQIPIHAINTQKKDGSADWII
jgi:hypothetical protein